MKRHGVRLGSNYNIAKANQPMNFGPMPQFCWASGVIEIPISTVFDFKNTGRHFDYNFNASLMNVCGLDECIGRHQEFLERFYAERGVDAIAVLVMHSWSFLKLDEDGTFSKPSIEAPERFDRLLSTLESGVSCFTSREVLALLDTDKHRLAGPFRFDYVQTQSSTGVVSDEQVGGIVAMGRVERATRSVLVSTDMSVPVELACVICGTKASAFTDFNGRRRRCSGCGSVERQRVFASVFDDIRRVGDFAEKNILVVAPSHSELLFLQQRGITKVQSLDIRPEVNPDIIADICDMPQVEDASFDVVLASMVLTHAHNLEGCLSEFHRVLRPGGQLLTCDPLKIGAPTEEFNDVERITSWYGRDAYDKYRIGTFRSLGELDIADILGRRFTVRTLSGEDVPTGRNVVWYVSTKLKDGATTSSQVETAAEGTVAGNSSLSPRPTTGHLSLAESLAELHVTNCTICGDPLQTVNKKGDCPSCGQPSRTRSLAPIVTDVVAPLLSTEDPATGPLLAFAMTGAERKLIEPVFPSWRSVSLFGTYATCHETGVDARDLSRYDDCCFAGVFSIQLFDYFLEHDQALQEMYRVLAPGGVLFTLIASYRLHDGTEPPHVAKMLEPNSGYFPYWPSEVPLPSITVGRAWLVDAMRRAGFESDLVQVKDDATGDTFDWFVGQKPNDTCRVAQKVEVRDLRPESVLSATTAASQSSKSMHLGLQAPTVLVTQQTQAFSKIYSTPVDPEFGFSRVTLNLTIPSVPEAAHDADFAEHAVDSNTDMPTDLVIALQIGGVLHSEDLGRSWEYRETPESGMTRLWNSFTLADGHHLIQGTGPHHPSDPRDAPQFQPELLRFDHEWKLVSCTKPGKAQWHGTRSVDQRGDTVIYAEYPENSVKYRGDFADHRAELEHLCENSRVFRSRDGGITWDSVLVLPWTEIRHFHTVIADPFDPGVWWLSSGDSPSECRIWRSEDDGLTWTDVTGHDTDFAVQPQFESSRQAAFRYTAMIVTPESLVWGSDDWLGDPLNNNDGAPFNVRVGARIFVTPKTLPLKPASVAHIGNPVRTITDVGVCYLVTTEAKRCSKLSRPQVYILSQGAPYLSAEVATIDRFATEGTGFTYSKASRKAKDGRFFSLRGSRDVFDGGPKILRWDIDFQ
jgi:ubiquinone/menaquinone biosynthesis C-methylase UbiE